LGQMGGGRIRLFIARDTQVGFIERERLHQIGVMKTPRSLLRGIKEVASP
jgi:hypothetical protein